jgi:3-hydroxyisobutyrate dehydrogenase
MAGHLCRAGYRLTAFNRTRSKAEGLLAAGACWAATPRAVAEASDMVFSIVGHPRDVREVLLGSEGALAGCRPGSVLIDMTTSEPRLAQEVDAQARPRGVASLDAPVSGGDVGARQATLSIMVGGDPETFQAVLPCFQAMGKTIVRQGPAGSGQHAKMVNQTLIATGMIGVCEALLYAHRAGLDIETVLQSVSGGAAGSWSLANYAPRILANRFDPGFMIEHFIKDLKIVLREAERMELALPGLALAHQLYVSLKAQGEGQRGIHALQLALGRLSGIDWERRSATG